MIKTLVLLFLVINSISKNILYRLYIKMADIGALQTQTQNTWTAPGGWLQYRS